MATPATLASICVRYRLENILEKLLTYSFNFLVVEMVIQWPFKVASKKVGLILY